MSFVPAQGERGSTDSHGNGLAAEGTASNDAQTLADEKAKLREAASQRGSPRMLWRIDGRYVRNFVYRELGEAHGSGIG